MPKFDDTFIEQFHELLAWRRDVRHFKTTPVDRQILEQICKFADMAPSVGNSQPWRFVQVSDAQKRVQIQQSFLKSNEQALQGYEGEQAALYAKLKLSGLKEAPEHFAVFCDEACSQGAGLGRQTMPETLAYSCVMAIYNFWLAARAFEIGVGWVSILDPVEVQEALQVPDSWKLVAYLCVGKDARPHDTPELERVGWQARTEAQKRFLLD